jgi:hypothetical protein
LTAAAASAQTRFLAWDVESGTVPDHFNLTASGSMAVSISTERAHSGTRSLKYHPTSGDISNTPALDLPNLTTVYAKWWWWVPSSLSAWQPGRHMFRMTKRVDDNYQAGGQLDTVISAGGTDFSIDILFSQESPPVDSGTLYHDLVDLPSDRWFEFAVLSVLNTGGQSNGILRIWIDGTLVVNRTNVFYRRAGSSMSYNTWQQVTNFDGAAPGDHWYMDDMEVWDAVPPGAGPLPAPQNLRVR